MKASLPKIVVSVTAAAAMFVRHHYPGVLDLTDLILIAVILLPWLASLIRSAEFPGGFKIEFQDVQRAVAKVTGASHLETKTVTERHSFVNVAETDPNLALVGLRIELERRLRELAARHSIPDHQPLMTIFTQLQQRNVLSEPVLSGLQELVTFGNQAAHGASVDPAAASWAMEVGPQVLATLDKRLGQTD